MMLYVFDVLNYAEIWEYSGLWRQRYGTKALQLSDPSAVDYDYCC